MDLFSFYADNQLIKKATSSDETPTPGYVFHEIVGLTHKSVEACQNLENQLVSRLDNDSPIVKLKALRVIKHILLKGHTAVKRDLMGRVASIRPCLHARGAPDPLRGDALWQSVRTEAQEVLNVLFDTEQRAAAPPVAVSAISSDNFSSSNYGPSSGYGSSSGGSGSSTPYGYGAPGVGANSSAGSGFASTGSSLNRPRPLFESGNAIAGEVKNKLSSLVTPKPTNELSNFGSLSTVSHHASTSHTHAGAGAGDWGTAHQPQPAQSTGEEETLVDEISNPTGASATLSFQALDQFVARSSLLDQLYIAELLFKKLEARAWQSRQKALAALEALLLSPSAGEVIKGYCSEHSTIIHNMVSSVHGSTREKAKQVLALLGVRLDVPEKETSHHAHATATTSLVAPDSPSSPPPERVSPPIINSLFAGLTPSAPPTSTHTPAPTHAPAPTPAPPVATPTPTPTPPPKPLIDFGFEEEPAPVNNTNGASMFAFLEITKPPPSPSPTPSSSSHVPLNSSASNDLDALSTTSPAAPPTSTPTPSLLDLFDTSHEDSASVAPLVASTHTNGNHSLLIDFSSTHIHTPTSSTSSTSLLAMLNSGSLSGPASSSTDSFSPSQPTPSFLTDFLESTPSNTALELLVSANDRSLLTAAPPTAPSKPPMSAYKPAPPAPRSTTIVTTSATSVYAPLTHIPRAAPTLIPPGSPASSHPSSPSSFGFVETKKQDSFGDLWSQQKTQMKSK